MAELIADESDVEFLRNAVIWFLESQDPELDDGLYDLNDQHLLRTILLPRIAAPFDPDGGTSKDRGLLWRVLETALESGEWTGTRRERATSLKRMLSS